MKPFEPTYKSVHANYLTSTQVNSDVFLWEETENQKIYIWKYSPNSKEQLSFAKKHLLEIVEKNVYNKDIVLVNPTENTEKLTDFSFYHDEDFKSVRELCQEGHEHTISAHKKIYHVSADDSTHPKYYFLGTKAHLDSIITLPQWNKLEKILEQNYRPFLLGMLGRRGHDRRYRFFKKLHSLNSKNFLLKYSNLNSNDANVLKNELDAIEFEEKDGVVFPYSSHEVLEPIRFHAKFSGDEFMLMYTCLLSMCKMAVVVETCVTTGGFLTEKSLTPFLTKTIPIYVNGHEHIKSLERLGFCTFVDEFGTREAQKINSWDGEHYYDNFFALFDRINQGNYDSLYESSKDKIEHNRELALKIHNMRL